MKLNPVRAFGKLLWPPFTPYFPEDTDKRRTAEPLKRAATGSAAGPLPAAGGCGPGRRDWRDSRLDVNLVDAASFGSGVDAGPTGIECEHGHRL